jgi:myo-inositol-1(or 4)-monophosphatase
MAKAKRKGARFPGVADPSFDDLLATAHRLADIAGPATLRHFRQAIAVENKAAAGARFDPVTLADREAERSMRDELARVWPDHDVLGEEHANVDRGSRWQWILDPIDGTRAFIMGLPLWGTLIGLRVDGQPLLGIVDQPYTGERFWTSEAASHMRGPLGEQVMRKRPCARLEDAILSCTHPSMFKGGAGGEREAFEALSTRARMTRYGGDCYAYCMLAMGQTDLIVEAGLKPYDIAALVPIIERAGGIVTGWDGGPALESSRVVAAGDAKVHAEAVAVLKAVRS